MPVSKKPYRGTRDLFPTDQRVQNHLFQKMREIADVFGYEPYNGPMLEELELYYAKSGEELVDEQIYSFTDKGDRRIAIRPEMTPSLARMIAQVHKEVPKPIRWYTIPNLMRYEKPQRGRMREHWQFNADIFAAPDIEGELEIIQLVIMFLESFGASDKDFEVCINDRKVINAIFSKITNDDDVTRKLYKIIDKSGKMPEDKISQMIGELPISNMATKVLDKYRSASSIDDLTRLLQEHDIVDSAATILALWDKLRSCGLEKYLSYSPNIVRGLDYYTGVIFEVFDKHPDNNRAICGGGAYHSLMEIFGEQPISGVGFGLGDITLRDFLKSHGLLEDSTDQTIDVFLAYQKDELQNISYPLAQAMRREGISVLLNLASAAPKKIFSAAEKRGATWTLIVESGDSDGLDIKNLSSGERGKFNPQDYKQIVEHIKSNE